VPYSNRRLTNDRDRPALKAWLCHSSSAVCSRKLITVASGFSFLVLPTNGLTGFCISNQHYVLSSLQTANYSVNLFGQSRAK
jgi:hypothetical protein